MPKDSKANTKQPANPKHKTPYPTQSREIMDATESDDVRPAATDVVGPSLHLMPEVVLGRILQNFWAIEDAGTLVSLSMVCSSLKSALTSDVLWAQALGNISLTKRLEDRSYEDWGLPNYKEYALRVSALKKIRSWQRGLRSTDNIVLVTLGGPDGVRNLASSLLHRMNPEVDEAIHQMHLRSDTVSYLTELLQDYMVTKLQKAFACTTFRSNPDDRDPVVHADDIALPSKLDLIGTGMPPDTTTRAPFIRFSTRPGHGIEWTWPVDNCSDLLSPDESRLLIRRFAYRAGL